MVNNEENSLSTSEADYSQALRLHEESISITEIENKLKLDWHALKRQK